MEIHRKYGHIFYTPSDKVAVKCLANCVNADQPIKWSNSPFGPFAHCRNEDGEYIVEQTTFACGCGYSSAYTINTPDLYPIETIVVCRACYKTRSAESVFFGNRKFSSLADFILTKKWEKELNERQARKQSKNK